MALTVSPATSNAASADNRKVAQPTDYLSTTALLRRAFSETGGNIVEALELLRTLSFAHSNASNAIGVLRTKMKKRPDADIFEVERNGFVTVSKRIDPPEDSITLPAPRVLPITETYRAQITPAAIDRARAFAEASKAPATRRAYASDLRDFEAFCRSHGAVVLPAEPQTVALYASHLAEYAKLATIRRRMVAISQAHRERGLEPPTKHDMVRRTLQGIARTLGAAQAKKSAMNVDCLGRALLTMNGDSLKALRDRAILLLGFAGALRRSEIAALDVADLHFAKQGLLLTIRRSKTDQTGEGAEIAIPYVTNGALCAATAVRTWLNAADITAGPVFRTFSLRRDLTERRIDGRDIANLVKAASAAAQLKGDYSGHSLRAGFVTSAAEAGATLDNIARTTRHKSLTVLTGYIRRANLFEDPALAAIVR